MFSAHVVVVFFALVALAIDASAETDADFEAWKAKHGRNYRDATEYAMRHGHFKISKSTVDSHNAQFDKGEYSYFLALNRFADWTPEEKAALLPPIKDGKRSAERRRVARATAPTTYKDWTTTGFVPPVKDQGQCGCCWAFSSADASAYYYDQANNLASPIELSTQELVDCALAFDYYGGSDSDTTAVNGCNGGTSGAAYSYIQAEGIDQNSSYPYTSGTSGTWSGSCNRNAAAAVTIWINKTVGATGTAGAGDETAMATYLGTTGVGVVYVYADCDQFMYYAGGILTNSCSTCTVNGVAQACGSTDHAVLAVGYLSNATSGQTYYKIKNSWSTDWGEAGYIRMNFGTNEVNIAGSGVMYPIGIGQSTTTITTTTPTPTTTTAGPKTTTTVPTTTAGPKTTTTVSTTPKTTTNPITTTIPPKTTTATTTSTTRTTTTTSPTTTSGCGCPGWSYCAGGYYYSGCSNTHHCGCVCEYSEFADC